MIYPCSPKQTEDWHYNYNLTKKQTPSVLKLEIPVDNIEFEILSEAYRLLIQKHESLRTIFPKYKDEIAAKVLDYEESLYGLKLQQLGNKPNWEPQMEMIVDRLAYQMKDLKNGPLSRGTLFLLKDGVMRLVILVHHIVCDNWSAQLIRSELKCNYKMLSEKQNIFKGSVIQLGTYFQKRFRQADTQKAVVGYWQEKLKDLSWQTNYERLYQRLNVNQSYEGQCFPPNYPLKEIDLSRHKTGETIIFKLGVPYFQVMSGFKAREKISYATIFNAVFSLLFFKLSGKDKVLIQTHFVNRFDAESKLVIGNLIGKALLLNQIDLAATFTEFAGQCYSSFFRSSRKILFNDETLKKLNICTGCFLFYNFLERNMHSTMPMAFDQPLFRADQGVESPLLCDILEHETSFTMRFSYHLNFYNAELVMLLFEEFKALIRAIENPNVTIVELL